jgi:large subunit ribosomal protein L14
MKPISARVCKSLQAGSYVRCADNSGATLLQVIAVKNYKGVKGREPKCGIASWIIAAVKEGDPKITHEVVQAIIVRQKKEFRRMNGMRVKFEDNAAVLVNEKGDPRGTKIKGPIAKEVVERLSQIGKIATTVL